MSDPHTNLPTLPGRLASFLLVIVLSSFSLSCFSQAGGTPNAANAGLPINGVFSGGTIDTVQLNNGNLHVDIPLLNLAGVGIPLRIHFVYDSKTWNYTYDDNNYYVSQDSAQSRIVYPGAVGYRSSSHASNINCGGVTSTVTYIDSISFVDEDGTAHPFPAKGGLMAGGSCGPAAPLRYHAGDASGIVADRTPNTVLLADVKTKSGTTYYLSGTGSGNVYAEDANGNTLTASKSYNSISGGTDTVITDTAGRSATLSTTNLGTSGNTDYKVGTVSYIDQYGHSQAITLTYTTVTLDTTPLCALAGKACVVNTAATLTVPSAITLQDGSTYRFHFLNNSLGDLESVTLPTGGVVSYTYGQTDVSGDKVLSRTVSGGGQTAATKFQYNMTANQSQGQINTTIVTDPLRNDTRYTCTIYGSNPLGVNTASAQLAPCYMTKQEVFTGQAADNKKIVTKDTSYTITGVVLPTTTNITWSDTAQTAETDTTWDSLPYSGYYADNNDPNLNVSAGNVMSQTVYDYGVGSHGVLLQTRQYSYLHQQSAQYVTLNILDRQVQDSIYDAQPMLLAQTVTAYDNFNQSSTNGQSGLLATSGTPNHDYVRFGSSTTLRGLPTSVTRYVGAKAVPITTYINSNDLGMPSVTTDARGNSTTYTYGDQNAFVSTVTLPSTNGVNHVVHKTYNVSTGLLASEVDQNAQLTTYTYDSMMRPLTITRSDSGSTGYSYTDPNHVVQSMAQELSISTSTTTVLDGLGRTSQVQITSDPVGTIYTDTSYDLLSRVSSMSNQYRATSESTYGVTSLSYDALGRKTLQNQPDTSMLSWTYSGTTVDASDELTKGRSIRTMDALGRVGSVLEVTGSSCQVTIPNSTNRLPPPAHPCDPTGLTTTYVYDALGNLLSASQAGNGTTDNGRSRSFIYDSLSRLSTSTNPESGTVTYSYLSGTSACAGDPSLPCSKTDARGVTVSYAYDALNRLVSKTYPTGSTTPSSCYSYDESTSPGGGTTTITNPIGRLTTEWTQVGACASTRPASFLTSRAILAYDPMGRATKEQQCTPANCTVGTKYALNYSYDLAGNVTQGDNGINSITWMPKYDTAGRLSTVTGMTAGGAHYPTQLFNATEYGPFGLTKWLMGGSSASDPALTFTKSYDNRMRVTGEIVTGIIGQGVAKPGSAVISISGGVQSK